MITYVPFLYIFINNYQNYYKIKLKNYEINFSKDIRNCKIIKSRNISIFYDMLHQSCISIKCLCMVNISSKYNAK